MAPNGTSRKTPAPATNTKSNTSLIPQHLLDESFTESEKKSKVKVKDSVAKALPKVANPGKWDSEVSGISDKKEKGGAQSPLVNKVPSDIAKAFPTGRPLEDKPAVVKCNHCKRAIMQHKAKEHIEGCLNKKQEKQRKKKEAKDARDAAARKAERDGASSEDEDDEVPAAAGKTAGRADVGGKGGKKRKAEDEGTGAKKKKKKDEPKAKAPRPKAPVDVEKQCGVELPQGGQCARSLTCKSHSMGAKRAVPGRSAPYDKLLAEYQRKNQAKLQKAALESQPHLPDDDLLPTGPVDSEEEKDLVLAAITRSRPQPLYHVPLVPLRKKYQYMRLKEMLGSALGGRGGGGLFGTGVRDDGNSGGGGGLMISGVGAEAGERRPSAMGGNARGFPGQGGVPRKPSVSAIGMT